MFCISVADRLPIIQYYDVCLTDCLVWGVDSGVHLSTEWEDTTPNTPATEYKTLSASFLGEILI